MAQIIVQTLVNQVRVESDLGQNQVCLDSDIAAMLSDAGSDLYDVFTGANQLYNVKTFLFALAGGVGGNIEPLPADFQQGHSVDVNPNTPQPYTLKYLSNWLDRNRAGGSGTPWAAPGGPREYIFLDGNLVVLPAMAAAGNFGLYYTPQWLPLALPGAVPAAVPTVAATISSIGTGGQYDFSGALFTAANVGDTLVVTGAANAANNGSFPITSVPNPNAIIVTNPNSVTEGAGAAAVVQPQGTTPTLITQMNPWIQYLKTHASITIRNKRDLDVSAFEARLAVQKDRIQTILQERQQEPTQPPMTRGTSEFWGGW